MSTPPRRPDQATAVDVAIVNWNTTAAAVEAARAYVASEGVEARVTIVDNDSAPEQRELLGEGSRGSLVTDSATKEPRDSVRLELLDENAGYGRAANLALDGGEAELICVSNADVVPQPGALAALAAVAAAEPRAGMVGPAFGVDPDPYHSALPTGMQMLGRIVAGSFDRPGIPEPAPGEVVEVGQPSGACFLMRRAVWEQLGGFDEGFFLWYEDVDLAKRLEDAGYRNLVSGSARVSHAGAGSFAQVDRRRQQAIRLDSVRRYIGKHHPGPVAALSRPLLAAARRLRADGTSEAER
ncbi:MAG TPA: glycosyltransferase [Solirubrobacterales bacterium]|nr:glycosyltransferase [Solirubrobacterales bacterium]